MKKIKHVIKEFERVTDEKYIFELDIIKHARIVFSTLHESRRDVSFSAPTIYSIWINIGYEFDTEKPIVKRKFMLMKDSLEYEENVIEVIARASDWYLFEIGDTNAKS